MPYATTSEIQTAIPAPHLNDALDDDRDGTADTGVLDSIIAACSQDVDAYLAGLYTVPFDDPAPAPVRAAALAFTCERIYDRRAVTDKNPWRDRADFWRKRLQMIGNRELPLDAATDKSFAPGAAITENVSADTQST